MERGKKSHCRLRFLLKRGDFNRESTVGGPSGASETPEWRTQETLLLASATQSRLVAPLGAHHGGKATRHSRGADTGNLCLSVEPLCCPWPKPTHEAGGNANSFLPTPAHIPPCLGWTLSCMQQGYCWDIICSFSPLSTNIS